MSVKRKKKNNLKWVNYINQEFQMQTSFTLRLKTFIENMVQKRYIRTKVNFHHVCT